MTIVMIGGKERVSCTNSDVWFSYSERINHNGLCYLHTVSKRATATNEYHNLPGLT